MPVALCCEPVYVATPVGAERSPLATSARAGRREQGGLIKLPHPAGQTGVGTINLPHAQPRLGASSPNSPTAGETRVGTLASPYGGGVIALAMTEGVPFQWGLSKGGAIAPPFGMRL